MEQKNVGLYPLVFSIICLFILSRMASADEPGYLINEDVQKPIESPPPQKPKHPPQPKKASRPKLKSYSLNDQFARARGPTRDEVELLYTQRISCNHRLYSPSGWALEGDGDLKVTKIAAGNYEIDFPTFFSFNEFNPYKNGLSSVRSESPRKLTNLNGWVDGQALQIGKIVAVTAQDPKVKPQRVPAIDELRVLGESYPPMFLVREVVYLDKRFALYMICQ
jgi:hypothetical protein